MSGLTRTPSCAASALGSSPKILTRRTLSAECEASLTKGKKEYPN